jgi:hypothetical protein
MDDNKWYDPTGTMEGKVTHSKEKTSTENVVNIAGAKPSLMSLILMCGLMSFNTVSTFFDFVSVLNEKKMRNHHPYTRCDLKYNFFIGVTKLDYRSKEL